MLKCESAVMTLDVYAGLFGSDLDNEAARFVSTGTRKEPLSWMKIQLRGSLWLVSRSGG